MADPIDDTTTQKIFKTIEEHSNVLKKIGGRLSKVEESKVMKPIHVVIHDEDEREDWDERDKAKYERNMQFEKRNDMFTIFLQQILSGRLLLVVIVRAKK